MIINGEKIIFKSYEEFVGWAELGLLYAYIPGVDE